MQKIEHYAFRPIPEEEQSDRISVIVAVYNIEAYLEKCVRSIRRQTYRNLQIILVDDGSTDGCAALCDRLAGEDPRIRVLHKKNGGLSDARNAGSKLADGEYIAFVDGDDWIEETMYEGLLSAARAFGVPLAVCRYRKIYRGHTVDDSTGAAVVFEGQEALESFLREEDAVCIQNAAWNKLYRADLAKQLQFDVQYTLGEDLQFVLDYIALLGQTVPEFGYRVMTSPLTFYDCSRGGTLSTKYHANYCEIWPKHFAKLNAACHAAACPAEDMRPLHRAELQVFAEGVADIMRRDPSPTQRLKGYKAEAALRSPWLRALLERMKIEHCYSAYYLPCRWRNVGLVCRVDEARRTNAPLYGKLDWAGYYLLLGKMKRD